MAKIYRDDWTIAAKYSMTGMSAIGAASSTVFTTQNLVYDRTGAFNPSTYEFLCQESGLFLVIAAMGGVGQNNAGNNLGLFLQNNAVVVGHLNYWFFEAASSPSQSYEFSARGGTFECVEGDILQVFVNNGTNFTFNPSSSDPTNNYVEFRKVG